MGTRVILLIVLVVFLLLFILRILFIPILIIGLIIYLVRQISNENKMPIHNEKKQQDDVLNAEYTETVEE